ncbi:MAG: DUF1569 domain-containing protein [Planctomycetota bacterium]
MTQTAAPAAAAPSVKPERRALCFESLEELLADAEAMLAAPSVRTTGNWSAGRIVDHVGRTIRQSVEGFVGGRAVLPVRWLSKAFFLAVANRPFPAGIKFPGFAKAALEPDDVALDEAVQRLRDAVALARSKKMTAPSPLAGKLSDAQWEKLHCRHAELHFSFVHSG